MLNKEVEKIVYVIDKEITSFIHTYRYNTIRHLKDEIKLWQNLISHEKIQIILLDSLIDSVKNTLSDLDVLIVDNNSSLALAELKDSIVIDFTSSNESNKFDPSNYVIKYQRTPLDRGILGYGWLVESDDIVNKTLAKNEKKSFIDIYRRTLLKVAYDYLPLSISRLFEELNIEFDHIILLGIDRFLFSDNKDGEKLNHLVQLIEKYDDTVAIILSEDSFEGILTQDDISWILEKYSNVRYVVHMPYSYLFTSSYVDQIICHQDSSLIIYGALFYKRVYLYNDPNNIIKIDDILLFDKYFSCNLSFNGASQKEFFNNIIQSFKTQEKIVYENTCEKLTDAFITYNYELNNVSNIISGFNIPLYPDKLRSQMLDSKAISFDLFDTLVERDIAKPSDIFYLVECAVQDYFQLEFFNYRHFRMLAEENKRRENMWLKEVTYDEIYDEFHRLSGIFSESDIEIIKELELSFELQFIKPKKQMVKEYEYSRNFVGTRSIISDIYLNKEVLEKILTKCGIYDYDHLLSSADYGYMKHDGKLFQIYLDMFKSEDYAPSDFLHIGDNVILPKNNTDHK